MAKRRHIPERTCAACGRKLPKAQLVRIVKTPHGALQVDGTGKIPGRGAYLCRERDCWEDGARRRSLERSLKTSLSADDRDRLHSSYRDLVTGQPSEI